MAKATTTEKTPAAKAPKAQATETLTPPQSFDARANRARTIEERQARQAGKELKLERFTVNPGHSVRKGGERYGEGEAIDLSPADAERLTAKGIVAKGDKAAKEVKANAAKADQAAADAEAAAEVQRLADEQAAKDKAAADEAAGKLSGAENR